MKLRGKKQKGKIEGGAGFQAPLGMPKNKSWLARHKVPVAIGGGVLGAAVVVGLSFLIFTPRTSERILGADGEGELAEPDAIFYSRLTGREVKTKAEETQAATCIMIENSPEARPQSGLRDAGVIYEAIAEGGITRFMAIYQEAKPDFIGPVRSVRMYYAEWAKPYNCSLAHAGGAADALNFVRDPANGFRDIDEFRNASTYWRQAGRYAPHNLYTSFERIDKLNVSRGYTTSVFDGFERVDADAPLPIPDEPIATVNIKVSGVLYNPTYTYDATINKYWRAHQSGGKHMDKAKDGALAQNAPDVVVAIKVTPVTRPGSKHANYTTTGSGTAHVFQNGSVVEGKWTRASVNSELVLTDMNGAVIPLNRGQVWISAYPGTTGSVSWK